jgi:lipid-A-disaccharide synthase
MIRIGLVVGEASGDALAAALIEALHTQIPDLKVEAVAGTCLSALSYCQVLAPMDSLSVMGLIEPLRKLPALFRLRRRLFKHFSENPPDVFIGVDAPDFNLGLEYQLKRIGIKTIHYVSPTVWAWRKRRVKFLKKAVNHVLALFPFEMNFLKEQGIPVTCVGHPFADQIPIISTSLPKTSSPTMAILIGSRWGELKYLAEIYLKTAILCWQKKPELHFLIPLISAEHVQWCRALWHKILAEQQITEIIPVQFMVNQTRMALERAEVVLVTSGTATLETCLFKKPMVVAYKTHFLTYHMVKALITVPYIALPNLLASTGFIPEYIQSEVQPERLGAALLHYFSADFDAQAYQAQCMRIHEMLRKNSAEVAAHAVLEVIASEDCLNGISYHKSGNPSF